MEEAAILIAKLAIEGHDSAADAEKAFLFAMKTIPVSSTTSSGAGGKPRMVNKPFPVVGNAIANFAASSPGVKKTLLDACAYCVLFDQIVTSNEAELLRAIAYALNLPLPPLLMKKEITKNG